MISSNFFSEKCEEYNDHVCYYNHYESCEDVYDKTCRATVSTKEERYCTKVNETTCTLKEVFWSILLTKKSFKILS